MAFAAKVYELECTSTGCSDTVQSVAVSAVVASTTTRVDDSGNLDTIAANTVRTQYAGGKWWMMSEGMGANYLLYSQTDTQTSVWKATKTGGQTDPFGGTNAWKIVEDSTAASTHENYWAGAKISYAAIPDNSTITVSVFVKKGAVSRNWYRLDFADKAGTARGMYFNLSTLAAGTSVGSATGGISSIGNGWYKIYVTYSIGAGASAVQLNLWIAEADNDVTFTGTPTTYPDGITVFGGQIEVGSYPTSYIPTSGSIAIRASEEGAVDTTDIWTGTATIANGAMFSFAAGASFAYMDNHLLTQYVKSGNKYRIRVNDDDDGYAVGFIGAADSAYAVGAELWDAAASTFESGTYSWAAYGTNTIANVSNALSITYVDNAGGAYNIFKNIFDLSSDLSVGALYLFQADFKVNAGSSIVPAIDNPSTTDILLDAVTETDFTAKSKLFNAKTTNESYIRLSELGAGEVAYIDNLSLKQVTSASANGVRVVTATDGATEGWNVTAGTDGFDYNNATYTVTIEFVEVNGYYQAMASLWGGDGWDAGTDMDTAGTMVVDWWPLTAQSTYPTSANMGIVSLTNNAIASVLYFSAPAMRLNSFDATTLNTFQADWTTAVNYKVALTWSTGGNMELYQDGIKSTDATRSYDGGWTVGTNLVFFFDNSMPTRISGLEFYDEAAADYVAQTSGNDGEINYTEVAPAAISIRGIHVRSGDTGTKIQNVTAAGDNILSCLICLEDSATITNTAAWTSGSAASLSVATGKTATGSNNYFSDAAVTGAGAESFTAETWSGADIFVDYANEDFRLKNKYPFGTNGTMITGVHDSSAQVDARGRSVYNIKNPSIGAYQGKSSAAAYCIIGLSHGQIIYPIPIPSWKP